MHSQEEDHPFIHDTINNKKTLFLAFIYIYRHKKKSSITNITNDYQKAYAFTPTYGDEFTDLHRHMISVVVFSCSNTLQSMIVGYAVTEMGCFYDYLDTAPRAKKMREMVILTLFLHIAQCITLNQTKFITSTPIAKARLKPLYSRLGFKGIKYFSRYINFEKSRKIFHYESGKSEALQKKTIDLQCYPTIPRRATFLYGNLIDLNENKYVFKDLN